MELYAKIAKAVETHGEPCYRVLATVASEALVARTPDRYFCFAIVRRLSEHGFAGGEF
jgi:hypothetical protein